MNISGNWNHGTTFISNGQSIEVPVTLQPHMEGHQASIFYLAKRRGFGLFFVC